MNQMLGRGRSMDVLDPIAMRFLPVLQYQMGDELEKLLSKETIEKPERQILKFITIVFGRNDS